MKIAHFISWQSWALLVVNFLAEGAVLHFAIRRRLYRRLVMLAVVAGFCLLTDAVSTCLSLTVNVDAARAALYYSSVKFTFYWITQTAGSVLLLLLSFQLVSEILPLRHIASAWAIVVFSIVGVVGYVLLPDFEVGNLLEFSTIADCASAVALLVVGLIAPKKWPTGFAWIVGGIVTASGLHFACSIGAAHLQTLRGLFQYGAPAASLVGTCLFLAGALRYSEHRVTT